MSGPEPRASRLQNGELMDKSPSSEGIPSSSGDEIRHILNTSLQPDRPIRPIASRYVPQEWPLPGSLESNTSMHPLHPAWQLPAQVQQGPSDPSMQNQKHDDAPLRHAWSRPLPPNASQPYAMVAQPGGLSQTHSTPIKAGLSSLPSNSSHPGKSSKPQTAHAGADVNPIAAQLPSTLDERQEARPGGSSPRQHQQTSVQQEGWDSMQQAAWTQAVDPSMRQAASPAHAPPHAATSEAPTIDVQAPLVPTSSSCVGNLLELIRGLQNLPASQRPHRVEVSFKTGMLSVFLSE